MNARIDAILRAGILWNRSWPFATPPSQVPYRDLLRIEARTLALLPEAAEAEPEAAEPGEF
ncbi:hypothetical protein D8770_27485 [Methylobacterium sp. DB1607]|nr:hypothetical protein [Methylobacterium sp. DB1607]